MRYWLGMFLVMSPWVSWGGDAPPSTWISAGAYSELGVIIPENASPTLQAAAETFTRLWEQCAGVPVKINHYSQSRVNVWLGPEIIPADLVPPREVQALGPDGCLLRTFMSSHFDERKGPVKHLVITGATDKGTLNGVFEFFQQMIGKQWLAPGESVFMPVLAALPALDVQIVPRFTCRELGYYAGFPPEALEYRRAHKLPDTYQSELSGAHTFYDLLPPQEFFAAHPEYYSEHQGKRIAFLGDWRDPHLACHPPEECGQLCCANPEVAEAVAAVLRERINARPEVKLWSVSQMDWLHPCQCTLCRAIDDTEKSPMGSLLTLVNRVAEKNEQAFPGKGYLVCTLAYQYSRKPPASLRPRANVRVQLCAAECDFGEPLDEGNVPENAAFVADLKAWSTLTDDLWVLDYAAHQGSPVQPFPNLHVLQSNIQLYDQYFVKGVFEASPSLFTGSVNEFGALRSYLLSHYLWDPDCSPAVGLPYFLNLYYGAAAEPIARYIDMMAKAAKDTHLGCREQTRWWNYDLAVEAEKCFPPAAGAPLPETIARRVAMEHLPVAYMGLVCPPKMRVEGTTLFLDRPAGMTLDQFAAALKVYYPAAGEAMAREVAHECHGKTPPRHEEHALVILEDDRNLLWIAPTLGGAVLRWKDKTLNVEWLRGFERYESVPGVWSERSSPSTGVDGPVAERYAVVEASANRAVLRATLENGLVLTRTLTLPPDTGKVEWAVSVENPSDQPVHYALGIHPEFYLPGDALPELWIQENSAWSQPEAMDGYENGGWNAWRRAPDKATCWAVHLPGKGLTLYNQFTPAPLGRLRYYANVRTSQQQFNLDLGFPDAPISPGEARNITAVYWVDTQRPQ